MSIGDVEALTEAVISEASRDRDRLLKNAEATAHQIRDQAVSDSMAEKAKILAEAESRAVQAKEQARAAGRLEAQQITLGGRESLLNDVFDAAADRLHDPNQLDDYDDLAKALLRDAVVHLDNVDTLVVLADPVTREALTLSVLADLSQELERQLSLGDALENGVGLIVQSVDRRVSYDSTFQQRLARQRSGLRADVFAILKGRSL
ncbi:MAG: hypothetical protein JXC32_03650 [Anaerolineae bacterium]|nr:hypothetical protein [Anaerolineae bacterium]